jgi:hypothetical protein
MRDDTHTRFAHFYSRGLRAKSFKNPIGPQVLFAVCFVSAEQTLLRHSLNLTCLRSYNYVEMPSNEIPKISNRIVCIVDRDAKELAAVISSYLFEADAYLPLFLLGRADVPRAEDAAFMSVGYVAYLMVEHTSVMIHNALARMGGCEYVVLAGLTEAQKTYLHFAKSQKIIEIAQISDIDAKLESLVAPKEGELRCKLADILSGLYLAQKQRKKLVIDQNAETLATHFIEPPDGLVLIENVEEVSSVVAVNYANSIDASVLIVAPLGKNEGRGIQKAIQNWKEKKDESEYGKVKDAVSERMGSHSLSAFRYATFFTEGLPYSLFSNNAIPCSQVHLAVRPDLFVLNNIMFSAGGGFGSAVVFSPVFFPDEETTWLCKFFDQNKYFLRALVGKGGTVANFGFYTEHWPYDILHICSHGGEVDGYEMSETFVDLNGIPHTVEFEEVIGVTPVLDNPQKVAVHKKVFPRKLDGLAWMSPELKEKKLDDNVINQMWKSMLRSEGRRKKIGRIALSCAIACTDSIHQGQFDALASYSSPIIFNNTCWSWHEVALFFLDCGARGYIGTLWAIGNDAAVVAAKVFYENVFRGTVLGAVHKALKAIAATPSSNIYVFWGLHFSSLPPGNDIGASVAKIKEETARSVMAWIRKIQTTKSAEVRRNSIRVLKSILREIVINCSTPDALSFVEDVKKILPELSQLDTSREFVEHGSTADSVGRECPIEYRTESVS